MEPCTEVMMTDAAAAAAAATDAAAAAATEVMQQVLRAAEEGRVKLSRKLNFVYWGYTPEMYEVLNDVLRNMVKWLQIGRAEVEAMRARNNPDNEEKDEMSWKMEMCTEIYGLLIDEDDDDLWESEGWQRRMLDVM